jgi:hypothetical protein
MALREAMKTALRDRKLRVENFDGFDMAKGSPLRRLLQFCQLCK